MNNNLCSSFIIYYFSGLKQEVRTEIQDSWTSGKVQVIAATCSFGMGVDKASVR